MHSETLALTLTNKHSFKGRVQLTSLPRPMEQSPRLSARSVAARARVQSLEQRHPGGQQHAPHLAPRGRLRPDLGVHAPDVQVRRGLVCLRQSE